MEAETSGIMQPLQSRIARITGRILLHIGLTMLLFMAAVVVWINVQQRILRYRAEHLLADIKALQLRTTTFGQARSLFQQWRRWGAYRGVTEPWDRQGECNEKRCDFDIILSNPLESVTKFLYNKQRATLRWHYFFDDLFEAIGGRPAIVRGNFSVRDGTVSGKWFGISITTPPPPHTVYTSYQLQVESYSIPRLPRWRTYYWSRRRFHPEYVIGGPNGCTGCLRVEAMFTHYASPAEVARLMDINLSCLTRWNPCRTKADIMPAAILQNELDEKRNRENPRFVCHPQVIETVSRETKNAAIVNVLTDRKDIYTAHGAEKVFRVRLIERLKRATSWKRGDQQEVGVYPHEYYFVESWDNLLNFRSGDRIILLFGNQQDELRRRIPWVEFCGALPLNESNLAAVRNGLAQDDRPE